MGDRIRKAARMQVCTLRLRGCRNEKESTVLAHLPSVGKGIAHKSPDWWGVFACSHCHDLLDRRIANGMPRWEIENRCLPALYETHEILIQQGLIKICD